MSESKTRTEGPTPKFILRILRSFCPEDLTEEIEGDLIQSYQSDSQRHGSGAANRKLLWNTIRFFRPGILLRRKITYQFNAPMVFRNHLKMAMRNFVRQTGFSTINVVGLASGITCAVLIVLGFKTS